MAWGTVTFTLTKSQMSQANRTIPFLFKKNQWGNN
jgi:hypothetical protein